MANEVNYNVDYDDERLQQVKTEEKTFTDETMKTYDDMINGSTEFFDDKIKEIDRYKTEQEKIQNENTDFAIQEINQQKDQAHKDYLREQSGAYTDWQKQSNEYGANAEKEAMMGMSGTGYSESSQVSMYTTYQNRVATAREAYVKAVQNYDNAITQARLQNNSVLAEIAHQAFTQQIEVALEGVMYKNNLITEKTNQKLAINKLYTEKWQNVLNQINTENALAEQIREFNADYELKEKQFQETIRQFDIEIKRLKEKDAAENAAQIRSLELQEAKLKEEHDQWVYEMDLEAQKLAEQKNANAAIIKGSGGGNTKSDKAGEVKQEEEQMSAETTYDSIMALGRGAMSAAELNRLVSSGEVIEYTQNGVQLFRWANPDENKKKTEAKKVTTIADVMSGKSTTQKKTYSTQKELTSGLLYSKTRF